MSPLASHSERVRACPAQQSDPVKLYVHMLNSTLTATERTLCCLLETHQTETGVTVPEVLRPFMMGIDFLPFMSILKEKSKEPKKKGGNVAAAGAAAPSVAGAAVAVDNGPSKSKGKTSAAQSNTCHCCWDLNNKKGCKGAFRSGVPTNKNTVNALFCCSQIELLCEGNASGGWAQMLSSSHNWMLQLARNL